MLFKTTAILDYSLKETYGYRLVANVDTELSRYYMSLIPKAYRPKPQMYPAHVSIVRKEIPKNIENWNKYQNKEISIAYDNIICFGNNYCWLNVFSNELEYIRTELGLEVSSPYTLPPAGFVKCFHMTIGNYK
jgi:hypothetical protein